MSSSACLITVSENSVEICNGAVLKVAKVSGLMPVFRWLRYASLGARVRLPTEIKMKSVKCSIIFAAAWVMLALKSMRYCSSSVAVETL